MFVCQLAGGTGPLELLVPLWHCIFVDVAVSQASAAVSALAGLGCTRDLLQVQVAKVVQSGEQRCASLRATA